MRYLKFRAYAPILKGINKGTYTFWYDIITDGTSAYIFAPHKMKYTILKECDNNNIDIYTGITDIENEELYENDIIEFTDMYLKRRIRGRIIFKNSAFRVICNINGSIINKYELLLHEICDYHDSNIKKIGDIYTGLNITDNND